MGLADGLGRVVLQLDQAGVDLGPALGERGAGGVGLGLPGEGFAQQVHHGGRHGGGSAVLARVERRQRGQVVALGLGGADVVVGQARAARPRDRPSRNATATDHPRALIGGPARALRSPGGLPRAVPERGREAGGAPSRECCWLPYPGKPGSAVASPR